MKRFVERSLGGSLEPFVAYLSEESDLTPEQLQQLQEVVRGLEARQEAKQEANRAGQTKPIKKPKTRSRHD